MKIPKWFNDWKENDYEHLVDKVDKIGVDVAWLKKIGWLLLGAVIAAGIASIFA